MSVAVFPWHQSLLLFYQFLFMRTRLVMSVGGFLTTIHSMMDVARLKLYL